MTMASSIPMKTSTTTASSIGTRGSSPVCWIHSINLVLDVDPFEEGHGVVAYTVTVPDPTSAGQGQYSRRNGRQCERRDCEVNFCPYGYTFPPTPAPTASNVLISGTPQVGQVLTGRYTYADAEEDVEGASTFRWLRVNPGDGSNPIDGATDRTYTLVAADEGAFISFEVTPVAQSGTSPGLAFTSDAVGPVAAPPNAAPTASNVLISGTAQVGQVLTGSFVYADAENDPAGASTFRWLRGDTPIAGATAPRYTLGAADRGALVSFEVTPVAQSGTRRAWRLGVPRWDR